MQFSNRDKKLSNVSKLKNLLEKHKLYKKPDFQRSSVVVQDFADFLAEFNKYKNKIPALKQTNKVFVSLDNPELDALADVGQTVANIAVKYASQIPDNAEGQQKILNLASGAIQLPKYLKYQVLMAAILGGLVGFGAGVYQKKKSTKNISKKKVRSAVGQVKRKSNKKRRKKIKRS